jgi:HEAT repeat protein
MSKAKEGYKKMEQNISETINVSSSKVKEALEKALKDPDEGVRQKAANSLLQIEAKTSLDTYILMLDSDDRATRIQAIYLLAELATEPAIELLQQRMRDPYDDVRAAVIQALGNSSDNYTTHQIQEKAVHIALMGLKDVNLSIKASAADALAKFSSSKDFPHDPRTTEALLTLLTTGTNDETEDAQPVISALMALGEIGDKSVVPDVMKKAKADNLEIKEAALKTLGKLRDPRAEACLIEALTSKSARIRMQAAESLGNI